MCTAEYHEALKGDPEQWKFATYPICDCAIFGMEWANCSLCHSTVVRVVERRVRPTMPVAKVVATADAHAASEWLKRRRWTCMCDACEQARAINYEPKSTRAAMIAGRSR